MAKESVTTTLDTTKRSILMMDPAQILIVGADFGDESTPGYDPRVKLPLDPDLVASIREFGVIRPVIARRDGDRTVKVDGGRRILHARAANLELQAENPGIKPESLIKVPVDLKRGDELGLLSIRNIANSFAVKDSPVEEAKSIQRLLDKGADEKRVCIIMGLPLVTIRDRLKLLDLAPEATTALESGQMTGNAALELAQIPMAEQVRVLQKARDAAVAKGVADGKLSTKVVAAAARDVRAATGAGTPLRKTPKEKLADIGTLVDTLINAIAKGAGKRTPAEVVKDVPDSDAMFSALRKIAKLTHPDGKTWDSQVKDAIKALATVEDDTSE